jgi:hypothetical protein
VAPAPALAPAVVVLVACVALAPPRGPSLVPGSAGAAALADSVDRASERNDTAAALRWARRLHALRPADAPSLYRLSVALHNYAVSALPGPAGPRPALRGSFDRAEYERRALALADSAAERAGDAPQWAAAVFWRGQVMEYLGLPLDALAAYRRIEQRTAGVRDATERALWIEAHLRDPLLPDRIRLPRQIAPEAPSR